MYGQIICNRAGTADRSPKKGVWDFDCNLVGDAEPEPLNKAAPILLTHRNGEIINVYYVKC